MSVEVDSRLADAESFVDVGAWEGDSIRSFLKSTDQKYHKIYAFEPDPTIFQTLQHHYGNKENILLHHLGLGAKDAALNISRRNTQSAFLTSGQEAPDTEKIMIKTLDEVSV